ncbi:MarR family winged helix-turn-helix transcriptional regulator [Marinibaculum pumilum]|uniref:MarR family winged helix-turn-helix transcriptional regulator n=1 Tax=Marinibaculum pumilum TaxID=1766165 RepID=A0ABV7L983_9PROT
MRPAAGETAAIPDLGLGVDTLFYRLMRLVNMTARPFFTDFAARYDLTINEWRVMLALNARPGLSVQEIAEVNGFDKMSASRAVRRLISHGRVVRATDGNDRRRTRHSLSPEGAAIFAAISPFALDRADALFGRLSAREVAQLKRILDKLERHAEVWKDGEAPARPAGSTGAAAKT